MTVKIIPCLDIQAGRVVKGINFQGLKEAGDPLEMAISYSKAGADELILLNIEGLPIKETILFKKLKEIKAKTSVPLAVGGGLYKLEDLESLFKLGINKCIIGSQAIKDPVFLLEALERFSAQKLILAVDVKRTGEKQWSVFSNGGKLNSQLDALSWLEKIDQLELSGILLTSMDGDGTKAGYDLELLKTMTARIKTPLIASGGAGKLEHFYEAVAFGKARSLLAASTFHYQEIELEQLKRYLEIKGISTSLKKRS